VLRESADRIDETPGEYDQDGHSDRYGYGRVNAAAAVRAAVARGQVEPPQPRVATVS
jgi:hypothetical protein